LDLFSHIDKYVNTRDVFLFKCHFLSSMNCA
jgi:hypothetical protein